MEPQVISLNNISLSFNPEKAQGVYRESFVRGIENLVEKGAATIVLEGEPGIGKTAVLSQLASKNRFDCISYFANKLNRATFNADYITEDIGRQLHFILKGTAPSDDTIFTINVINSMQIDLAKILKKRRKKLMIVLDGLDHISSNLFEQIKPVLDGLPWDSPSASIIVSGDIKYLSNIYDERINQKAESLRVLQFTLNESTSFFQGIINDHDKIKEIHDTWRGNPERLSDILRIISKGTTIEQFLKEDATEKNRLLDIEWKNPFNSIVEEWQFLALAIVCFDSSISNITKVSNILDVDYKKVNHFYSTLSYLKVEHDNVSFITTSIKDFAAIKLKKYEDAAHDLLVKFYTNNIDQNAISSLTGFYEKKTAWGKTIELLSIENLSKIISQSTSFSDIKSQIASGYKASINYKDLTTIQASFDNIFKFALYRSTFLELQSSDTRESEIQACVALKEYGKALSIATNAFLKEDRFKMLIIFAKECKLRSAPIDPIILNEISDKYESIDIDYLKENIVEIAINLAYTLPQLAMSLVEKAIEGKKGNTSLELLLTYLSVVNDKKSKKDLQNTDGANNENIQNNVLDSFFSSVGYKNELIAADEFKKDINKFSNLSDRLYMTRAWIKHNKDSEAIFDIMNLGLDLVLENSSTTKPSTTNLLDISYPLAKSLKTELVKEYIIRIDNFLQTVNTPTIDLIKLLLVIIEAEIKIDLTSANIRLINLVKYIIQAEDVTIKAEGYARCWLLLNDLHSNGFQDGELKYLIEEAKEDVTQQLDIILKSTADHHEELESTISVLAKIDIKYTIELITKVNTLFRRNWCYISALESYASIPMNEWDTSAIGSIFRNVKNASAIEQLLLPLVNEAYNQIENEIDGRHNFLLIIQNIKSLENTEAKCIFLVKSIAIFSRTSKPKIGLPKNYNTVVEQLKDYLETCWIKIENPWIRAKVAYQISAIIAEHKHDLANQYYGLAKNAEEGMFADNITYASTFVNSLSVTINCFVGTLKNGTKLEYNGLEYLIDKVNSPLDQVSLWSKFSVKAYQADAKDISDRIVTEKIIPIIDAYINEKKDSYYSNALIIKSASAIFLAQKAQLMLFLAKLPIEYKEVAIGNINYVLFNNVHESEPYDSTKSYGGIKFQNISDIVELSKYVESDVALYDIVSKLSQVVRENPSLLPREHKTALKPILSDIIKSKLPNVKTGIKHEGYSIVCEACLTQLDIGFNEADYVKLFKGFQDRVENIGNVSDKVFILDILAQECNIKFKKLRQEILEEGFRLADTIPSYQEKFERHLELLNTAKDVSDSLFSTKIKEINQEIFSIDSSDLFSTHRRLIDLAFKHDKALAERLISVLDTDPGRKAMTFPASKHLDDIKLKEDALEDYGKFGRLKTRMQIAEVAWKNLSQLNSDKRMAKPIEQSYLLLPIASRTPFHYSIQVFNLFINNTIKKYGTNSKFKVSISNMYMYALDNAQLTYDIICSLSLKKSYVPTNFSLKQANVAFSAKPGQRQPALDFITNYFSESDYNEVYIIDSYLSEKDIRFLRAIVECSPNAQIIVMTSLEGSKGQTSIDRPAFIREWKNISADPLPNMSVIRVNKADQNSPFHDRYILSKEAGLGLKIGSSINAIGGSKGFGITVMSPDEIASVYEAVIEPFANQRIKVYGKDKIRYESFDL